jgi:glutaredoxin
MRQVGGYVTMYRGVTYPTERTQVPYLFIFDNYIGRMR